MLYWITTITWQFGAGKTKNVFMFAFEQKIKYWDSIVIIANIPYDFVDIVFNSSKDYSKINDYIVQYMQDTNDDATLNEFPFKRILYIVDEAHIYLDSRDFKTNFDSSWKIAYTQCRKRNIDIRLINQHFSQWDKRTRILSKYIRKYYRIFGFWNFYRDFELKKDDSSDLKDESVADQIWGWLIAGWVVFDWIKIMFKPKLVSYFFQKYLSYYVIGFWDKFIMTYEEFKNILLYKQEEQWKK